MCIVRITIKMDNAAELEISHPSFEKVVVNTISTMLAAVIVISAFYPIECIEAKMQLGLLEKKSIFKVLRSTLISSHYQGCLASVIGHVLAWGIYICVSDTMKILLQSSDENTKLFFSCKTYLDTIGAFFYTTVYTPFSTMKIRLITEMQHNGSIRHYINNLRENNKLNELYSGYFVALVYICEGVIQLGIYEELKKSQDGYSHYFLFGVFSKWVAVSLTYPYRVVVSILQSRPINMMQTIRMIIKSAGFLGFYKGYAACLLRQLPPAGFLFAILEGFKFILLEIELNFWGCFWSS